MMNSCIAILAKAMLFVIGFSLWGEVSVAQYLECNTVVTAPDSLVLNQQAPSYPTTLGFAAIRVFVHVLRESDGSDGLNATIVDSMLATSGHDLEALEISLVESGRDSIPDSDFYAHADSLSATLFAINPHPDAIDIYLGPDSGVAKGRADGVPGSALVLTGSLTSYSGLSHLLGNCLGLYQTDETVFGLENPDGSNAGSSGDYVTDTAADPGLPGWVQGDCSLSAGFSTAYPGYAPDPTNIMSNAPMACWKVFTLGQKARALSAVESYAVLQAVTALALPTAPYNDFSAATNLRNFTTFPNDRTNATAIDFDMDGKKDVLVAGHMDIQDDVNQACAGLCNYFDNVGVPFFTDVTDLVIPNRPQNGTSGIILADYDNDGDLDFYAPNPDWDTTATHHYHRLYRNDGGIFSNETATVFEADQVNLETMTGSWGDYDEDGYLDLLLGLAPTGASSSDQYAISLSLYHNEQIMGGGPADRKLIKVTNTGILSANDGVFSLLWVDFDKDHDMDLVTLAYKQHTTSASKLYRNDGGTFVDVSVANFPARVDLDFGQEFAAAGDLDNDGDLDIAYHGKIIRGFFRNDLNVSTGVFSLASGWFESMPTNTQWFTSATGLGIFDFDLDGWLDFGISNNYQNDIGTGGQRLFRNLPSQTGFSEKEITSSQVQSLGLSPVDWNLDGYTELFVASRDPNGYQKNFFFRNLDAANNTGTNHWVGIRLDASNQPTNDCPCNTRGIGSTVIVTANGQTQAQIVDGGSGHAGQHDLDLSFGLGSYSGPVNVEVLWPCGQTQYATVPADQYNTLTLGWPTIATSKAYLEWNPQMSTVHWVFEWTTNSPSDTTLDQIEFPDGVGEGAATVYFLDSSRGDVEYTIEMTTGGNTSMSSNGWTGLAIRS